MRFWDSSALVPLLVEEPQTRALAALYRQDSEIAVWWGSEVECASAIARLDRVSAFRSPDALEEAYSRLVGLTEVWHEVQAVPRVKVTARRLLRVHPIRAADALQLAAAYVMAEDQPATLEFVCLDDRLVAAARREGFTISATSASR